MKYTLYIDVAFNEYTAYGIWIGGVMIAIKWSDYQKYGCPKCGCNSARSGNVSGRGTALGTCRECKESFVVLSDEVTKSAFGYCTGKKDSHGKDIFEYPEVQEHPRNGIPCHQWV